MAATVVIAENNSGTGVTDAITTTNFGETDAPNLSASLYPIPQNSQSYAKWQLFHVQALGGSLSISNLRVYLTATLPAGWSLWTNANPNQATYATNAKLYASPPTPVNTDLHLTTLPTAMPTSQPNPNVGVNGTLTNTITAASASPSSTSVSDWFGMQLICVTPGAGSVANIIYGYDESA